MGDKYIDLVNHDVDTKHKSELLRKAQTCYTLALEKTSDYAKGSFSPEEVKRKSM